MVAFDDELLSGEDLDNIEKGNEAEDDVDESSSDNEKMKKIFKIGERRGKQAQLKDQHVNHLIEAICKNEYFRRKLIFINNKPQKNKALYYKVIKKLNEKYESCFSFSIKTGSDQI